MATRGGKETRPEVRFAVRGGEEQPAGGADRLRWDGRPAAPASAFRNVVYYQNRFVVLEPEQPDHARQRRVETGNAPLRRSDREDPTNADDLSYETLARDAGAGTPADSPRPHRSVAETRRRMEMDASSVTMDTREIEIIIDGCGESSPRQQQQQQQQQARPKARGRSNPMWERISRLLLDDRMTNVQDRNKILNQERPGEYRVLKKVLNILFVTIGIALLLAVIVVVIYTAIV